MVTKLQRRKSKMQTSNCSDIRIRPGAIFSIVLECTCVNLGHRFLAERETFYDWSQALTPPDWCPKHARRDKED